MAGSVIPFFEFAVIRGVSGSFILTQTLIEGIAAPASSVLERRSARHWIQQPPKTTLVGPPTAKASGLTPFSINETHMESVARSRPVFCCGFCQLTIQTGVRVMWSRTRRSDISWRMSSTSCAACALFLTGGICTKGMSVWVG